MRYEIVFLRASASGYHRFRIISQIRSLRRRDRKVRRQKEEISRRIWTSRVKTPSLPRCFAESIEKTGRKSDLIRKRLHLPPPRLPPSLRCRATSRPDKKGLRSGSRGKGGFNHYSRHRIRHAFVAPASRSSPVRALRGIRIHSVRR